MMLVKKSNIRSLAITCFAFLSLSAISTLSLAVSEFTSNVKKIDIGQAGLNDMIAADFNNDGNMDVILSEFDGIAGGSNVAAIIIHFGDITGNFESTYSLPGPTKGDGQFFSPAGLAVGDVDGDKILDIAVAGLSNSTQSNTQSLNATRIFKGYLTGTTYQFRDPAIVVTDPLAPLDPIIPEIVYTAGIPYDVAIGNFTNDTFVDVVVAHELGVSLFTGIGNGKFDAKEIRISISGATNSPRKIVAIDMNNDGLLDIVTDHEVLFNNNDNTFTLKASYGSTNLPKKIFKAFTVDDFNKDNLNDVAYILETPTPQQSELVILLASKSGTTITYSKTTLPKFPAAEISAMATGDIDLDGIVDIIMTDLGFDNVIYLYTGIGDGTFSALENIGITPTPVNNVSKPQLLVVTKADNDRLLDIITANNTDTQTPSLSVLLQNEPLNESFVFAPKKYEVAKPTLDPVTLLITVLRKYKSDFAKTITYAINNDTAVSGTDFNDPALQPSLDFSAADKSRKIEINILVVPGDSSIADKSFNIDLFDADKPLGENAVITIKSNIITPTIGFSAQSFNLYEEPGNLAVITVTRTNSTVTSTVQVITQTITTPTVVVATAGTDYTVLTNKLITFNSGELSKTFTVAIVDDTEVEAAEKFIVKLVNPTNSTISLATATVTIIDNDTAVIVLPVANDDNETIVNNTLSKSIVVLANDKVVAPNTIDPKSVTITTDPTQGKLSVNRVTGDVVYTLLANDATGSDSFAYTIKDNNGNVSLPATVFITIIEAPIALGDEDSIVNNAGPKIISVIKNDSVSALSSIALDSIVITTQPSQGSISFNRDNGDVIYELTSKTATGLDSFSYTIKDTDGVVSLPATVLITIIEAPIAKKDSYVIVDTVISKKLPILDNDSATKPKLIDPASIKIITSPTKGLLGIDTATGKVTYTLNANVTGLDSFTYTVDDNDTVLSPSDVTTVAISIVKPVEVTPGVFSFDESNTYTVSEETGELIINVVRTLGSTGEVIVSYLLTENSAIAGIDYNDKTPTLETLTFAEGVTSMPITIEILKDNDIDPNEDFSITLTMVSAGIIKSTDPVKVSIIDSTKEVPTINPAVSNSTGGGGGCTLQAESRFDPVLPLLMMLALFYFGRRVQIKVKK